MSGRRSADRDPWSDVVRVREEMKRMALGAHRDQLVDRYLSEFYPRLKRATARMSPVPLDIVRVCEEMKCMALASGTYEARGQSARI
jgi:hypothetical protein